MTDQVHTDGEHHARTRSITTAATWILGILFPLCAFPLAVHWYSRGAEGPAHAIAVLWGTSGGDASDVALLLTTRRFAWIVSPLLLLTYVALVRSSLPWMARPERGGYHDAALRAGVVVGCAVGTVNVLAAGFLGTLHPIVGLLGLAALLLGRRAIGRWSPVTLAIPIGVVLVTWFLHRSRLALVLAGDPSGWSAMTLPVAAWVLGPWSFAAACGMAAAACRGREPSRDEPGPLEPPQAQSRRAPS